MDINYVYQKKRTDFGRQCLFTDKGPDLIDNYPANKELLHDYILKDPVSQGSQCAPIQAAHSLNTTRAEFSNTGINHAEGGWPKDVNVNDEEQTKRYRRKIEKDDNFNPTVMQLCKTMEASILQNNAINIYQQYFSDVEPTPLVERSSARTVNVYQDQCSIKRSVNHISWSPDGGEKLAISHCNLEFQVMTPENAMHSYIWDVENPNRPLLVFKPPQPIVSLEYNQKDGNSLVSGQYNGQVAVWDIRRGSEPVDMSVIEETHRDPVQNCLWINSKTGTEFFSTSTDGQVKWWDTRKMQKPIDQLVLTSPYQEMEKAMGATCLEYEPTIPTRFMVGTEQGIVISCNRKGKNPTEKLALKYTAHLGPVLACQRNPGFVKNFLTVGDWTARIWSEECKESAIMWTNFHKPRLTDGSWSPTRFSVLYLAKSDGTLDAWDILQQQKQPCLGVKVCDDPLSKVRTHEGGRLVATGNQKGTTYLVQFSENLSSTNKNDKMLLTAMFERESKREKILEARNREIRLKMKAKSGQQLVSDSESAIVQEQKPAAAAEAQFMDPFVAAAEAEFFHTIKVEVEGPDPEEDDILKTLDKPTSTPEASKT